MRCKTAKTLLPLYSGDDLGKVSSWLVGRHLARCASCQLLAFKELVERYRERCYWIAHNLVKNHDEARDIVQEGFIRVYKALERFNPRYRFYTWLYQIITNLSIDSLRKRARRPKVSLEELGDMKDEGREAPYSGLKRSSAL